MNFIHFFSYIYAGMFRAIILAINSSGIILMRLYLLLTKLLSLKMDEKNTKYNMI